MALDAAALAEAIKEGLGFSDQQTPEPVTNIAEAIVAHMQTAVVNFITGTITGDAPPSGGSLINGAGQNGVIVLVPSALEALFYQALGNVTPEIQGFAVGISSQIMTALAEYPTGSVTGVCSNTPTAPGVLAGQGQGGVISGIDPSAMSSLIASSIGQEQSSPELDGMCEKLVETVESDAEVSHATGTVVAAILAGGGPITLGAAPGGIII